MKSDLKQVRRRAEIKAIETRLSKSRLATLTRVQSEITQEHDQYQSLLFGSLQSLLREELRLSPIHKKNSPPLLFHSLLCHFSPLYQDLFAACIEKKMTFLPTWTLFRRDLFRYEPRPKIVRYPALREDLYWVLQQKPDPKNRTALVSFSPFGFSVFHEMAHSLFFARFPRHRWPHLSKPAYYLLIESLVSVLEATLAEQLGSNVSDPLWRLGLTARNSRTFQNSSWHPINFDQFVSSLLTHYLLLQGVPKTQISRRMPEWATVDLRPIVGYSEEFIHGITPKWLKSRQKSRQSIGGVSKRGPLNREQAQRLWMDLNVLFDSSFR